jgi:hypothetical protein
MNELQRRRLIFVGALVLSLVPAWLGLTALPQLAAWPRFFNAAVIWLIAALAPAGFARVQFDGTIWLADTAWLICLGFWALAGFACARGLERVPRAAYLALLLPLILTAGFGMHWLLSLFGIAAYAGV